MHTSTSSPSTFSVGSGSLEQQSKYVLIELLNAKSYGLLRLLQDRVIHTNVDCVVDYEIVRQLSGDEQRLDQVDLMVRYLEAQRKVYIDEKSIPGRRLVKFTLNSNRNVVPSISEIELSFLKVGLFFLFPLLKIEYSLISSY